MFAHFRFRHNSTRAYIDDIIRSKIFNVERLEQHAESLAEAQKINPLLPDNHFLHIRLRQNKIFLQDAYRAIAKAIGESSETPPAAEWLIDNYFVIEEQIRDIINDFPISYYNKLPKLSEGFLKGYPRVYGIAWACTAHTDSFFAPDLLEKFIRAYQRNTPLNIAELWAFVTVLRITLVENLRRAADHLIEDRRARMNADREVERLLKLTDDEKKLNKEFGGFDFGNLPPAFTVQFIYRLRDQDPRVAPFLHGIDQQLQSQGQSVEEIVRAEHHRQGSLTVTVRNIITSMRLISTHDWSKFFESVSLVDERLRANSHFADMDLPTRSLYRHAIEVLAARSSLSELDIANKVLELSGVYEGDLTPIENIKRLQEPGYFLIDAGQKELKKQIGYRVGIWERISNASTAVNFIVYILANVFLVTGLIELGLTETVHHKHHFFMLLLLSSAVYFPAWEASITLINRLVVAIKTPKILPAMSFRSGIPDAFRTMVVVPTLLGDLVNIQEQVERLEVHYLSNVDDNLSFGLLSDWKDGDHELTPDNQDQLVFAREEIAKLNLRYPLPDSKPRFFLLHRQRLWNPAQNKWMGWERKRGKLQELNRVLRGAADTTFLWARPDEPEQLPKNVRFVITLDIDTRLPRGAAQRLVGKMAHPLNRPCFDLVKGYITEGYGVLQPRVSSSLPERHNNSFFQRLFYSASGIDPYAFAISDVYQDLFQEGSYIGKGIYDLDAFEQASAGRIPENIVLSHDLLEGIFARAGLVSDIEFIEEFPSRYDVANSRQHRWARGDWQLFPWIFGAFSKNIPSLGHWKMVDNLRRTFTAPSTFFALILGWMLPLGAASLWTLLIISSFVMPLLIPFVEALIPRSGSSWPAYFLTALKSTYRFIEQVVLYVAFLPHQAWTMLDAIIRTLWRLFVTHSNLLEWVTAADSKIQHKRTIAGFYIYMAGGLFLTLMAGISLIATNASMWKLTFPFIALWLISPAIAAISSYPVADHRIKPLNDDERKEYRLIARETWRFFEHFVGQGDNDLPPDNFQEDPKPVIAHRTSPTNIGLYLLSIIAARDFGWLSLSSAQARLSKTFDTLEKMERFRGHFYNWYATENLQPLTPRYISSVDSGNLAGYLLIVAQTCEQAHQSPILNAGWVEGLQDTVIQLQSALSDTNNLSHKATHRSLVEKLTELIIILDAVQKPLRRMASLKVMHHIEDLAAVIADLCSLLAVESDNLADANYQQWGNELQMIVSGWQNDIARFAPWLVYLPNNRNQWPAEAQTLYDLLSGPSPLYSEMPDFLRTVESCLVVWSDPLWTQPIRVALLHGLSEVEAYYETNCSIAAKARSFFKEMNFSFLLDSERQLLSIGYQVENGRLDTSCYDLLASEARLASMVAIAKGDIPSHSWFRLGRTVTAVSRRPVLVSWSGSMFEYLMPTLVVREPTESLLGQTNRMIVRRQIDYGKERGVPWGVSESAYSARDFEFTYQYLCFGVPGLGLKRGLGDNIVIAPYATALASMINPKAALKNLQRIKSMGGRGVYGWYESIDFTKRRLPEGQGLAVVRTYMSHHQGMSLIAIHNALYNGVMRDHFHAEPIIQATELLLQELPPRNIIVMHPRFEEVEKISSINEIISTPPRCFKSPHGPTPRTNLLSNGKYAVMVTAAGSGYSQWQGIDITRWREDPTRDNWGHFIYLRDVRRNKVWSATYQPTCAESDSYAVAFFEDRAEYLRQDDDLHTTTSIVVSSEDQGEVRRVSILNKGHLTRDVELTSYSEIVLASKVADTAHPSFSKIFVETEYVSESCALLATRRPRSREEKQIWAVHLISIGGDILGEVEYETDRMRFIGRGRSTQNPHALEGGPLSNTVGTVLDPIFSLRGCVRLNPGQTAHISFWTLIAFSREEALELIDKYRPPNAYNRASAYAWTRAQLHYQHLGITPEEAHLFQRLANHVLYTSRSLRPHPEMLKRNILPQSTLWQMGISGDKPIILLRVDVVSDLKTLRHMIKAHEYWLGKQLEVDLVIINEQPSSYLETLQTEIELLVRTNQALPRAYAKPLQGCIYVLRSDQIPVDVRSMLQSVARAVIIGHRGSLSEQMALQYREDDLPPSSYPRRTIARPFSASRPDVKLEFFNGTGGFADGGRSYVILLESGKNTPAPWINVIANARFGFHVSAEGAGYTWALNSREYKITPWSNDPVSDEPGEVLYLQDLETNVIWSPTASPVRKDGTTYVAKHGMGYSEFEVLLYDIKTNLTQCVPLNDAVKISNLRIRNTSFFSRRLSVTSYVEWVLGSAHNSASSFITTDVDSNLKIIVATNPWSNVFNKCVAFIHMSGDDVQWTCDRREFIGRNGNLQSPSALNRRKDLSGKTGAGLDACAALQTVIELKPGQEMEIRILLGHGEHVDEARNLVEKYRHIDFELILNEIKNFWDETLSVVTVKTPERSFDIMQNGWLMYQTLVCRVFARSAFYQSSGAYGYRDQLQDVMALAYNHPKLTRAHILRAAGRQFSAGDVQHWWLPSDKDAGLGIRTRFADDPLWLPYVTAYYVDITGDKDLLGEEITFLEGQPLKEDQHEAFFLPEYSERSASLYEHCALAIDHSLTKGMHGLSLFGGGDWNDGMNRVGIQGRGESVWMCWFLLTVIKGFLPYALAREPERAGRWRAYADTLKIAIEENAWDGAWYRRGYYDDGAPLGSASSTECKIDSIAQSWAVISGEAPPERQAQAMQELEKQLIRPKDHVALLFTPPFDKTPEDPGYIKGYPIGVRENGGQYTHAALWSVLAYAILDEREKAFALFDMLNPIKHATSRSSSYRYKVEPYVVAADIYSNPQHMGRGGWTWYTGSAGWMYRIGLESILGFKLRGDRLHFDPCIPSSWPGFEIAYRYKTTLYTIKIENTARTDSGFLHLELDSILIDANQGILLEDDQKPHYVRLVIG